MLMLVNFPLKLAWLPIMALSNCAFLMCEWFCTKLFCIVLSTTWHALPSETFGPTVALMSTTSSPIKHGGIIFEFSSLTDECTRFSPSSCKNPSMRVLVSTVTFLLPQSIHSSTYPGTNFKPLTFMFSSPSVSWYSPPLTMLLSSKYCNSARSVSPDLK